MAAETFEQFLARTGLPYNDTGWVAYVGSGSSDAGQQDVAEAQQRQAQGVSTGGTVGATAQQSMAQGANPGYATDTFGGGPGSNTITLTPAQAAAANAAYQQPGGGAPGGAYPRGYFGGGRRYTQPYNPGAYGQPWGGYASPWGQDQTAAPNLGPQTMNPWTGQASHQPAQGWSNPGYDWASQMGGYNTNINRQAQAQPQQQVPYPWQVNPARYNELSTVGRGLLQGAAGQQGWDWGDYQEKMRAAAPQGNPVGQVNYGFARPRGVWG